MKIRRTLYVPTRKQWRSWLMRHHQAEEEIWLVYYKKDSGKPRIAYNDAVEEALCFGWIDSTVKKIDHERFAQRFSRRKPGSSYSVANIIRLRSLIKRRKVRKSVIGEIPEGTLRTYRAPKDILSAIKKNPHAWENFKKFSGTYKEIRIGFIDGARKRPKEFKKRLRYFIAMTEKNRQFGFGGIEKHY